MMTFDEATFQRFMYQFAPLETLASSEALTQGFSNRSFRLKTQGGGDYVVKCYAEAEHNTGQDSTSRAKLEYAVLQFLHRSAIPCPEALYLHLSDPILHQTVIVTRGLQGAPIMAHPANPLWAEKAPIVAECLARIHQLECPPELVAVLPQGSNKVQRFTASATIPDYLQDYPDGPHIWQAVREHHLHLNRGPFSIVHGDFWSGNVLWDAGQLTGILDWENIILGTPALDVAYCRLELAVDGMDEASATFLHTYEAYSGGKVEHLALCELIVATDPMWQHAPYLSISPYQERFRQFVADALKRL